MLKQQPKVDDETKRLQFNKEVLKPLLQLSPPTSPTFKNPMSPSKVTVMSPRMKMYLKKNSYKNINLGTLGKGKIISENDARSNRTCSLTIKWTSIRGQVYCIKASDFLTSIKDDSLAWRKFLIYWVQKDESIKRLIQNISNNLKKFIGNRNNQTIDLKGMLQKKFPKELDIRLSIKNLIEKSKKESSHKIVPLKNTFWFTSKSRQRPKIEVKSLNKRGPSRRTLSINFSKNKMRSANCFSSENITRRPMKSREMGRPLKSMIRMRENKQNRLTSLNFSRRLL